jgi:catechol 2,3-dioxygenase
MVVLAGMKIKELGHVVLYVTSLDRVAGFYRDTLGFQETVRAPGVALFSSGRTHHELLLIEVGGVTAHPHGMPVSPGLYHIGFKVADSHEELRQVYRELVDAGVHVVGTADHAVTHSIYILDPDGNELELYADVSDTWKTDPQVILTPPRTLDLR